MTKGPQSRAPRGEEPLRLPHLMCIVMASCTDSSDVIRIVTEARLDSFETIRAMMWVRTLMRNDEIKGDVHSKNAKHKLSTGAAPPFPPTQKGRPLRQSRFASVPHGNPPSPQHA